MSNVKGSGKVSGKRNGMWKGGRPKHSSGARLVFVGIYHHLADARGYAFEHRVKAELKLGRKLRPGERVQRKTGKLIKKAGVK